MKSYLAAALLATTALATPHDLPTISRPHNATIHTRQVGQGEPSGIDITIFAEASCKGAGVHFPNMQFAQDYAQQLRSYRLSDDIGDDDILTFWADTDYVVTGDKAVDKSLDGNVAAACATYVYDAVDSNREKGCHTLPNVVGCVTIMVDEAPRK